MSTRYKQLYRSRDKRMIAGVCGGIGEFFSIDPTVVRMVFVLGTIFGYGLFVLIYIIMLIVVPEEPAGYSPITTTPTEASPTVDVEPAESDTTETL